MAIHVQDPEADRMLRDFARRRKVGLTAAIKLAVKEADRATESQAASLRERVQPLVEEVRAAMKKNNTSPDDVRRFIDEGWDDL